MDFIITTITLNYDRENQLQSAAVYFSNNQLGTSRSDRLNVQSNRVQNLNGSVLISAEDYQQSQGDIEAIKKLISDEVNHYFNGGQTAEMDGITYLGGGWYELPSGEKVQGLDEVEQATQETAETTQNENVTPSSSNNGRGKGNTNS